MDRFLIIRFGSIGNTLVSIPAVRALRKAFPAAFIAMIVSPGIDELLSDIPWIDELIVYDMHGIHKSLPAYLRFIHELRKRHFDTVIVVKRFLRSELIGLLSGAKRRIGFETGGKSGFLTDRVPYAEGTNIVALNMTLMKPLGINSTDLSLELDLRNCADYKIMHLVQELKLKGHSRYVVLHPGGKTVQGAGLSAGSCVRIISRLSEQFNLTSFLVGDNSDAAVIESIVKQSNISNPPLTAVGLPLKELGCLIQHASLFIGNDSGPCHIADAVGTPGIILYPPLYNLGEHLKKWKPAGEDYIAITPPESCGSCDKYPCDDRVKARCVEDIDIESIFHYTEQILNKRNV